MFLFHSGREQFHGSRLMYCRGAAAIFSRMMSQTGRASLELEDRFLSLTDSANSDSIFALVGNKADLTDPQAML